MRWSDLDMVNAKDSLRARQSSRHEKAETKQLQRILICREVQRLQPLVQQLWMPASASRSLTGEDLDLTPSPSFTPIVQEIKLIRPSPSTISLISDTRKDWLAGVCFLQFSRAPFNQASSTIFKGKENIWTSTTPYLLEISFANYSQGDG